MNKLSRLLTVSIALLTGPALASADMRLDRVLLSSGGVAYLEYRAQVDGDAVLDLSLPLEQVDDLLKSLVVLDPAGRVEGISLPGREPLEQRFRKLPFDRDALASPQALLEALRGERVEVTRPQRISGQLLDVEPVSVRLPDGLGTLRRHRVSILGEDGLRQLILEDAQGLRFTDAGLQQQVQTALQAIADFRDQDSRTARIALRGDGAREVRVGFVTDAPLWKTSYRLVLRPDAERSRLQGWAHLENLSGQDWNGVGLTLVSGNPVTFRQALYQAYFVDRPEVPVEVSGRVLPPPDSGALEQASTDKAVAMDSAFGAAYSRPLMEKARELAAPAPVAARKRASNALARATLADSGSDAAGQILFTLPRPVSLANGDALMTPVIDRPLPSQRLSLYQPATHADHPLDSVRIDNDGEQPLPPGVVTLYGDNDDAALSYLGDARLDALPAGDHRLLSFAIDRQMRIQRDERRENPVIGGSISQGVLHLQRRERAITVYRVKSLGQRRLWIEHPRRGAWKLTQPRKAVVETTAGYYRLGFSFAPGEERSIEVVEERPIEERLALDSLAPHRLALFARYPALPPRMRQAFRHIGELRQALSEAEQRVGELQRAREEIDKDQRRLRENMQRLDRQSDLYQRYVAKLDRQEDTIERNRRALHKARRTVDEKRRALEDYIAGLRL